MCVPYHFYQNGSFVEAVIMRYDTRLGKYGGKPRPGGPRSTLCISSQVSYFPFLYYMARSTPYHLDIVAYIKPRPEICHFGEI